MNSDLVPIIAALGSILSTLGIGWRIWVFYRAKLAEIQADTLRLQTETEQAASVASLKRQAEREIYMTAVEKARAEAEARLWERLTEQSIEHERRYNDLMVKYGELRSEGEILRKQIAELTSQIIHLKGQVTRYRRLIRERGLEELLEDDEEVV